MAIVTINQGESIESALRRFKRKVMTEEIIKDAKKHAFFIPQARRQNSSQLSLASGTRKKAACVLPPRLVGLVECQPFASLAQRAFFQLRNAS